MNDILSIKKEYLLTGRGSAGIYLIVKTCGLKKVIAPSNLCYAALYPVLFAGAGLALADTDPITGNMNYGHFLSCREKEKDADAVIVPHMYGNPCKDIFKIKKYCDKNGLILIEDCASAMGAEMTGEEGENVPAGSVGDYVIYSTGYAKTLDLGRGGVVTSDSSLEDMRILNDTLPAFSARIEKDETFFSRLYRMLRNDPEVSFGDEIYSVLREKTKNMFLYGPDKEYEKELRERLGDLEDEIASRRRILKLYEENICYGDYIRPYKYCEGAVPWRFNIFAAPSHRRELIGRLLKKNVPVSDWYPDVSVMFGINEKHEGSSVFEEQILNFPLIRDKGRIKEIAEIINKEAMEIYGN
ncbi:MAG: DegT/DnrJ/EryC1/StrS family aminotransferase [Lachnospiraceae bacterium]|nr:DegT/DnrJ/EryC1/StrS family aminotransferase [Lachnospiraceae bacterium]